jgi:hypothetical protein
MRYAVLALTAALVASTARAEAPRFRTLADHDWCRDSGDGDWRGHSHCEVREALLPASGVLGVDAAPNGGIAVQGWERTEVRLEARVVATSEDGDPKAVASEVTIETTDTIRARGPEARRRHEGWHVSYRLKVPSRSDLVLHSMNGGIQVGGVEGRIELETTNGGVKLEEVAGNVHGRTTNGGVDVHLQGAEWEGEGLDVQTTNGGVSVVLPEGYNAHLETGTVNGGMRVDFPITVHGRIDRRLSTDLGHGGATIRVVTTNGGVTIRRR